MVIEFIKYKFCKYNLFSQKFKIQNNFQYLFPKCVRTVTNL